MDCLKVEIGVSLVLARDALSLLVVSSNMYCSTTYWRSWGRCIARGRLQDMHSFGPHFIS